jgi:hypothetical protein
MVLFVAEFIALSYYRAAPGTRCGGRGRPDPG